MSATTKVPTEVATNAVELIMGIMEQGDVDGPAAQINLGPDVVKQMREVVDKINEANK